MEEFKERSDTYSNRHGEIRKVLAGGDADKLAMDEGTSVPVLDTRISKEAADRLVQHISTMDDDQFAAFEQAMMQFEERAKGQNLDQNGYNLALQELRNTLSDSRNLKFLAGVLALNDGAASLSAGSIKTGTAITATLAVTAPILMVLWRATRHNRRRDVAEKIRGGLEQRKEAA